MGSIRRKLEGLEASTDYFTLEEMHEALDCLREDDIVVLEGAIARFGEDVWPSHLPPPLSLMSKDERAAFERLGEALWE